MQLYLEEWKKVNAWNAEMREIIKKIDPVQGLAADSILDPTYEVFEKYVEIGILNGHTIEQQLAIAEKMVSDFRKLVNENINILIN